MEGGGNWLPVCSPDPWAPSCSDWRGSASQSFMLEEQPWDVRQVQQKGASLQAWAGPGGSIAGTCVQLLVTGTVKGMSGEGQFVQRLEHEWAPGPALGVAAI